MNLASDILDKYSSEQVTAYLDSVLSGVLKNYKIAIEKNMPELLFACIGDITQVRMVLREMRKRDEARAARAKEAA